MVFYQRDFTQKIAAWNLGHTHAHVYAYKITHPYVECLKGGADKHESNNTDYALVSI